MIKQSQIEIATEFLTLCGTGRVREAFDHYVAHNFQHHNGYFPSDKNSLMVAMEHSAESEPNKAFIVKQTIAAHDRVVVHSHLVRQQGEAEYAVVHILRFEDEKIVEMWDVAQAIPENSPNQLGMF
jgi:predicted SnoaL-like aldol condensation-catalyzing enzyme